jgi:glycosyltransferase involved in cell wall biosynthesis
VTGAAPRVILGMTLYNNARHLPEALDSLLSQTFGGFAMILLDDASADGTEAVARQYAARDPRLHYVRHPARRGMIAAWNEAVDLAAARCPEAEFFAWASDHDRWHPRWLETLLGELDADPGAVLAYPITRRIGAAGEDLGRGPRLFDTSHYEDRVERWKYFCAEGVGSGDMVYGLMRMAALRRTGRLRPVLRPDRLLIAELTLLGRIRQVREPLWFRRFSGPVSIERQRETLVVRGETPRGFFLPASVQHVRALYREYAARRAFGLSRRAWLGLLLRYQAGYLGRHVRKTEASHAMERGIGRAVRARKFVAWSWRYLAHETVLGLRAAWGRMRRRRRRVVYAALTSIHRWTANLRWVAAAAGRRVRSLSRRAVYRILVLSHRAGLRRRGEPLG